MSSTWSCGACARSGVRWRDLSAVRGRTVLVGEMGGADDVHRTDAGAVFGVEVEAGLIERRSFSSVRRGWPRPRRTP